MNLEQPLKQLYESEGIDYIDFGPSQRLNLFENMGLKTLVFSETGELKAMGGQCKAKDLQCISRKCLTAMIKVAM